MILVALALLGAATVLFVLTPVFGPEKTSSPSLDAAGREIRDLEEKKLRLYDAIKDLDFEKQAGKVSAEDYQHARDDYLGQVADVLARIDVLSPPAMKRKRSGGASSKRQDAPRCSECGEANPAGAKFCMACGKALKRACSSCDAELPEEAKFCLSCGKKVAS